MQEADREWVYVLVLTLYRVIDVFVAKCIPRRSFENTMCVFKLTVEF